MPWLVRDGKVLASLEVAEGRKARAKGLLGRSGIEGALLISPARSVHTFGMRFPIDVAFCDEEMVVLRTVQLRSARVTRPALKARYVIEAEAGAFVEWELHPGDRLDVKG